MKVVKQLMHWISKGKKTYYITGNHDEMLRRFTGLKMGSFTIVDKLVLELSDNTKAWIFHGDVFDVTMQHSKWLTKMGAIGYDTLILVNRFVNFISEKIFRRGKISLLKNREIVRILVQQIHQAFFVASSQQRHHESCRGRILIKKLVILIPYEISMADCFAVIFRNYHKLY
jgi:UDP-2,3-diacylglucosamine pyrophosphatase LpxH